MIKVVNKLQEKRDILTLKQHKYLGVIEFRVGRVQIWILYPTLL